MTPNDLGLSILAPDDCAKFHKIRFKIATAGAMTVRQTDAGDLITSAMLYNSNGTDKDHRYLCDRGEGCQRT